MKERLKKKLHDYLKTLFIEINSEQLVPKLAEITSVTQALNERLQSIPVYICFLCGNGIVQGSGYISYMEKHLHAGVCFDEYCRITDKPDQNYKTYRGEPIKEFGPSPVEAKEKI